MSFERLLFLGFPVDEAYQAKLLALNPQLLDLFIQKNGEYLQEMVFQGQKYLGRVIASPAQLADLDLLESHIYSLLNRLLPSHPYEGSELLLFPYIKGT